MSLPHIPLAFEIYISRPWIDENDVEHRITFDSGQIDETVARQIAGETLDKIKVAWRTAGSPEGKEPQCRIMAKAPREPFLIFDTNVDGALTNDTAELEGSSVDAS